MSLLKTLNELSSNPTDLKKSDGNDAGSTDVKSYNVSFNMLRNSINSENDKVTSSDINDYLERAHEINNEVDTIQFGLETDDNRIIKVWVNEKDAQAFQDEMRHLLGIENDIEEAINTLAAKYDIVDIVWPDADQVVGSDESAVDNQADDLDISSDLEMTDTDDSRSGVELARAALAKINTNESGDAMSIGKNFYKRVMNEDTESDVDGINDGLNIKLDPRQRAIMLRLRRSIDRRILALFAMAGIPGRYLDVDGIDGLIKEAGLRLRSSPSQLSAFNGFYEALGTARGFAIQQGSTVEESKVNEDAENLRGAFIQQMLERVLVSLGLPESLVANGGPQPVSVAMYATAKLIEDDTNLESLLRIFAQRLKLSSASEPSKMNEEVDVGSDPFLEQVVQLMMAMGVPEANLNYQRANLLRGLREFKMSIRNRAGVEQRVKALMGFITSQKITGTAASSQE